MVTPFVGVWIETRNTSRTMPLARVTPFVGVWIETSRMIRGCSMERVTPFVGVWIETVVSWLAFEGGRSHTLRGCVD